MKLEKIEPLDSPNYLRLIFDDGKRLKAPAFKVVELGLTIGAEVSPEDFLALENAQSFASCKERAVRILTVSGLSKKELQKRLVQKGEREEDAEAAVSWLEELHLIDDLETAKQLVRSANLRGYGRARVKNILYEKGIPKELWDEALEEFGETDGAIDAFLRKSFPEGRLTKKPSKKPWTRSSGAGTAITIFKKGCGDWKRTVSPWTLGRIWNEPDNWHDQPRLRQKSDQRRADAVSAARGGL